MAAHEHLFYIGGEWVDPATSGRLAVIDPATEEPCAEIALGAEADIDRAVAAARAAFPAYSATTIAERLALLRRINAFLEIEVMVGYGAARGGLRMRSTG